MTAILIVICSLNRCCVFVQNFFFFALVDTGSMICTETHLGCHVKLYFLGLILTKIETYQQILLEFCNVTFHDCLVNIS
jgi:hypothetical protein